jgi:hypothetical protein
MYIFAINTQEKLITPMLLNDCDLESITFNVSVQIFLKTFNSLDDLREFVEPYQMTIDYGMLP